MGQYEVLGWLINERGKDEDRFFSSEEIYKGLKEKNGEANITTVRRNLFPLLAHGYIESELIRGNGFSVCRRYRASVRALKEIKD